MNKQQLINTIISKANLSRLDASRVLNATTDLITTALASGERVQLTGLGSFVVKQRDTRIGCNPQTGETIQIKAYKVVAFKSSGHLKQAVNH